MTKEIWKDVVGYEGLYKVSNKGNVRSLGRVVRDSIGRVRNIKPRTMSPSVKKSGGRDDIGYLEVRLTIDKHNKRNFLVHRLVAESFLENPDNKPTVNHKDGDKHNNNLDNLEWATYSENNFHAYDNGLKSDNRVVVRLDEDDSIVGIYKSMHEADRQTGVDYRKIHRLCNSYDNFDGEYYWDYIENFKVNKGQLYFAKTREDAIIPTRESESAGYDFYASVEATETELDGVVKEQLLEKGKVNFVKTGIASAMSDDYFLSLKSERSSVAKYGINVLAGVIDSGYRGEIALMVVPLVKDVLISDQAEEVEEYEDLIIYPLTKAIAQGVLLPVPKVEVKELPYEELLKVESERGTGGWGSSGK